MAFFFFLYHICRGLCSSSSLFTSSSCSPMRACRLPPGPWPPKPLIGDVLALGNGDLQHRSLARLAERYGPVMSLRLGTVLTVVVSTPEAMREIFDKNRDNLAGRPIADAFNAKGHSANSLFGLDHPDAKWRAIRRFTTMELLAPRRLAALQSLCMDKVQSLARGVSERRRAASPCTSGTWCSTWP
ncbi:hypothetical protein GUJ93_ZPchr0013g35193 [Zizania palustris]|uniref:Cytochrome P450 n=1 Tax=Zizania palustris TaxID=103762 RepID=A0A8J5WWA6_ZIZPA|nr:hypothetical protein GUJ93_ZPchr0013g35193 [Zizania palustris]